MARESEIKLLIQENRRPQDPIVYTDDLVTKTSQGGLHCQARCYHHTWRQCSPYDLNLHFDNATGRSHPCPPLDSRKRWQTTHAVMLTDLMSLPQKWKWNGKPRLECVNGRHPHSKLLWVYCRGHAGVMGTNQAHRLASGLRLEKSEVLRSLRHYLRAQSQGHHTIDCLEEWVMERGSARQSSLKGREMSSWIRWTLELFQRQCLGNFWEKGMERIWAFLST